MNLKRKDNMLSNRSKLIFLFVILLIATPTVIFCLIEAKDESPRDSKHRPVSSASKEPLTASRILLSPIEKASRRSQAEIDALVRMDDVAEDQWVTEVLSDRIRQQLGKLESILLQQEVSRVDLEPLVTDDFVCEPLRPIQLVKVFQDDRIVVHRGVLPSIEAPISLTGKFAGVDCLKTAIEQQSPSETIPETRQAKFKLVRIEQNPEYLETSVLFEGNSKGDSGARQQQATWICRWTNSEDDPRLMSIRLSRFEESKIEMAGARLYLDRTDTVLGRNDSYRDQVIPSINSWLDRIPKEFVDQFGHHGLAVGDVNNDGLDDIYVCDAGGLPNRLYVQQQDGTAKDLSQGSGVDFLDNSVSALMIDLDNDGDQDLVIGMDGSIELAENDGTGQFVLRNRVELDADLFSMCSADYDNDGMLDIFACGYDMRKSDPATRGLPFPFPYHDANNGGKNTLLRNQGDFHFSDVTDACGLSENNSRFSMAASWEDYDNDGDLDLYVANDFGRNNLYRNDKGFFTDAAATEKVEDHASGMSVSWADFNRDGLMDLYVGNMFSAAGNRITYQRQFVEGVSSESARNLQRMARGNSLFRNSGKASGGFTDVSEDAAVNMGRWAWASKFADLSNDGWPDLIVANGYLTNENSNDL